MQNIVTKKLREVHYSVIQFHFSLLATSITGLIDLGIFFFVFNTNKKEGPVPHTAWPLVFTAWFVYLEAMGAGLINVISQNVLTVVN
jgi:hypothetical protein